LALLAGKSRNKNSRYVCGFPEKGEVLYSWIVKSASKKEFEKLSPGVLAYETRSGHRVSVLSAHTTARARCDEAAEKPRFGSLRSSRAEACRLVTTKRGDQKGIHTHKPGSVVSSLC